MKSEKRHMKYEFYGKKMRPLEFYMNIFLPIAFFISAISIAIGIINGINQLNIYAFIRAQTVVRYVAQPVHSVSRLLYRIALEFSLSFNDCTYYTRWHDAVFFRVMTEGVLLRLARDFRAERSPRREPRKRCV